MKIRDAVAADPDIQQKDVLIFTEPMWSSTKKTNANSTENYRVFDLTEGTGSLIQRLDNNIQAGLKLIKDNSSVPPMWKLSDINSPRLDQQMDAKLKGHETQVASLLNLIQLFLPGPVNIYYGQEIVLPSNPPSGIAPQHGTMRWQENSPNAGFSTFNGTNFFSTALNADNALFDVQYKNALSP
uniref:Uncharacterized protein n=1 Tax=Ditylenchus dipsaci TaxID=166011 RepID=A0A915EA03_9BILA